MFLVKIGFLKRTNRGRVATKSAYYKSRGISLPTVDALIASTAIIEDCQMVTANKKDFPMPQLKFYPL